MGFGCSGSTVTISSPFAAYRNFLAANGTNKDEKPPPASLELTLAEAWVVADGIMAITPDNEPLRVAFFDYYKSHPLRRMDDKQQKEHESELMITLFGATAINRRLFLGVDKMVADFTGKPKGQDIMKPADAGTTAMHELAHTNQAFEFGPGTKEGEGIAYGIEYFLAKRFNKTARAAEIMQIPTKYTNWIGMAPWAETDTGQWLFCKWYLMMKWCYENIDGSRNDISAPEAMDAVTELVLKGEPFILGNAKTAARFAEDEMENTFNWEFKGSFSPVELDKRIIKIRDVITK